MAANIGEVQGHGDSAAWKAQKSNVLRIFEAFRVSTPEITELYPSGWLIVLVQTRCSRTIYQQFAHFLLEEYKIPFGIPHSELRCI